VIELLAPYHPRKRLPHYRRFIVARAIGSERCVILVSFAATIGMDSLETRAEVDHFAGYVTRQAKSEFDGLAGGNRKAIPACHLRTAARGIYGRSAMDDMVVDAVFGVWRLLTGATVEVLSIGFVLAEQQRWRLTGRIQTGNELPPAEQFFFRDRANKIATVVGGRTNDRSRDACLP
jgi:hypothetical protein